MGFVHVIQTGNNRETCRERKFIFDDHPPRMSLLIRRVQIRANSCEIFWQALPGLAVLNRGPPLTC